MLTRLRLGLFSWSPSFTMLKIILGGEERGLLPAGLHVFDRVLEHVDQTPENNVFEIVVVLRLQLTRFRWVYIEIAVDALERLQEVLLVLESREFVVLAVKRAERGLPRGIWQRAVSGSRLRTWRR